MKSEELIKRASAGTIRPSEIAEVVRALESGSGDPYESLLILGRANAIQFRPLVEKYLDSPDDPMLARLALQIICRYWGLAGEYLDVIDRFVRKVSWDEDDDVRLMAIDCCGVLLREPRSWKLLEYVYKLFRDPGERQIVRETAYCALAICVGTPVSKLPPASRHFDLEKSIDPAVLTEIERRVSGHERSDSTRTSA